MSIQTVIINDVELQITSEYIANVLWEQNIAKVSTITLIPILKNSFVVQIAYIEVAEWCDTEAAYNFVQRLKNPDRETRLVHNGNEEWWLVKLSNSSLSTLIAETYSTSFPTDFFVREVKQEPEYIEEPVYTEEDFQHMDECLLLMEDEENEKDFIEWTLECYQDQPNYQDPQLICGPEDEEDWLDEFFSYNKKNVTLRAHQQSFVY